MKYTSMQVGLITKRQLQTVSVDSTTFAGRWAINEMLRCRKHNCKWPDLHRLGTINKKWKYPKKNNHTPS